MRRLIRFAVSLYPASWRAKYGPEFDALLEAMNPGLGDSFNILKSALLMQFINVGPTLSVAACAVLGAGVAALVFVATPTRHAASSTIEIRGDDPESSPSPTEIATLAFSDRDVISLIEKNGLYLSQSRNRPVADLIRRFRKDVSVTLTTPAVQTRPMPFEDSQNTVTRDQGALRVSFTYPDTHKAQEVAMELASLVIDENLQKSMAATVMEGSAKSVTHHRVQFRVAGPPHQDPVGPNPIVVMSLGLAAAVLTGVSIVTVRRRRQALH
jgi:hypothetical protein